MRRLFVVGAGRSGTKFLMNTLNRSAQIHLAPEVHFFSSLLHKGFRRNLRKAYGVRPRYSPEEVLEIWNSGGNFGTYWRRDLPLKIEDLACAGDANGLSERGIYEHILDYDRKHFSNKAAMPDYAGEKTPSNMFHLGTLSGWFPDARFFFIYRDPVDVLLSEVNKDFKPDYPVAKSSPLYAYGLVLYVWAVWMLGSLRVLRFVRKYPESIHVVSYAGMTADHAGSAGEIFRRLALTFDPGDIKVDRVDSSFGSTDPGQVWLAPAWVRGFYNISLGWLRRRFDRLAINPAQ